MSEYTPVCEICKKTVNVGDWHLCPHDSTKPSTPFKSFEFEGQIVNGIQDANRIERESMQRYRNHEGAPIVFREFHQNRSNIDRNTLEAIAHDPSRGHSPRQVRVTKDQAQRYYRDLKAQRGES